MDANFPNFQLNMDLSLEQKFKMRMFEDAVETMNPEEARKLLLEASKLLMIKDNIIKRLMTRS
jgi:hypothetical protein